MNWFVNNWQILFGGIAGTAVVALIGWGLKRLFDSNKEPSGQLTAQGAKVSDSPVASGTGNSQRVNSPTNIYMGLPAPEPRAVEPSPVKVQHRLVTGVIRTTHIDGTQDETLVVGKGTESRPAVLVQFRNDPDANGQSHRVVVKTRIVYSDEDGNELARINDGCWLAERLNVKEFDFDESHELILAVMDEGELQAVTNRRATENYLNEDEIGISPITVRGFTSGTIDVRLTNKHSGAVLNHSIFTISLDPFAATLKSISDSGSFPEQVNAETTLEENHDPQPNIQYGGTEISNVVEYPNAIFVPREGGGFPAALVTFSNDAVHGAAVQRISLKASIIYRESGCEIRRVIGPWLERGSDHVNFDVDSSHRLMLCFLFQDELCTVTRHERVYHRRSFFESQLQKFGKSEHLNILVRLTNKFSGHCYFEGEFEVQKNPFSVIRIKTA